MSETNQPKNFMGIREIAKLAGVSTATVSRVINTPERTSEKTRKRVHEIIEKYDYVPNASAKALFSGQSNTIAIFIFDMYNPFYTNLIKKFNTIALEHDYILIICDASDDPDREQNYYEFCKSNRVAGIFYTAGSMREQIGTAQQAVNNIPIVVFDRMPFKDVPCFSIKSDADKAMQLLTDYLYKMNHRKIGFIGRNEAFFSAKERFEAFQKHIDRLDLALPEEYIVDGSFLFQDGAKAFDHFYPMADAPTAIIAANDEIAHGFIARANAFGVSIPDEFSICGMDAVSNDRFFPRVTSVRQNLQALSEAAFNYLIHPDQYPAGDEQIVDVSMFMGETVRKLELPEAP